MPMYFDAQAADKEVKLVFGAFTWTSNTVTKVSGNGFTVAHTATGKATVTLTEGVPTILGVIPTFVQPDTEEDLVCTPKSANATAGTFILQLHDSATLNFANPTGTITVYFVAALKRSTTA